MLIDSHAHLDMDDFKDDLELVIERAVEGGVERFGAGIPAISRAGN